MYDLRVIEERHVNYFTLLLNVLDIVVEVIDGEQLHGVMPVTKMIMEPRRWRSKELYDIGHIMSLLYIIACDVYYILCILFT